MDGREGAGLPCMPRTHDDLPASGDYILYLGVRQPQEK
ncbi:hypothetical protein TSMEX_004660 [Taenia solium]|eukprot:TsM_000204900 transcript=TsM_000204900 gene=TsM_000204900